MDPEAPIWLDAAHQDAATEWVRRSRAAIRAADPAALDAATEAYVNAVHNCTWREFRDNDGGSIDRFLLPWEYPDTGHTKDFCLVVRAAVDPQAAWRPGQAKIAWKLGALALAAALQDDENMDWFLEQFDMLLGDVIQEVFDRKGCLRYDLVAAFHNGKRNALGPNGPLVEELPATLEALHCWLMLILDTWDEGMHQAFGPIYGMEDGNFNLKNDPKNSCWLRDRVLPGLHQMYPPEWPHAEYVDEDHPPKWRGFTGVHTLPRTAHGREPLTITKLRALLAIVGVRLNLPCELEAHTRAARARGARARFLALRFACKLRVVYGPRAVARVQARYAPARVVTDPVTHVPIAATAPSFVLAELAADEALGGAVDMEQ